jgi:hypothetical protein
VNLLAFTSVYFSESGLFKGLAPIQIKKNLVASQAICKSSQARIPHPFLLRPVGQGACLIPELEKSIADTSDLCKQLRIFLIHGRRRGSRIHRSRHGNPRATPAAHLRKAGLS